MAHDTSIQRKTACEITPAEDLRTGWHYRPNVDIAETPDELTLYLDMPGVRADGIDLRFEQQTLSIRGTVNQRQTENTTFLLQEYGVGNFHRTFEIGEAVDGSKISAEYSDGVLVVHLPKTDAVKPRRIEVRKM